jgi:uncharacterized protein YdeI (YjbR/CyaY-like superfamily)
MRSRPHIIQRMGKRDKRIDQYIAKSADFAKPILNYLRELVHDICPDCEETLKWNSPTFMYRGMLCGFAAFKEHATFGFWKHELLLGERNNEAMGSFGRLTSVKDLPSKKELVALIKKAMKLNEEGLKVQRMRRTQPKAPIPMPVDLETALAKNKKARATFEAFPPSQKREYLEWITEAKTDTTRARRLETAVEWMSEGKVRNWKYT